MNEIEENKKILEETINHWERMINWVSRQDGNERVSSVKMFEHINEYWAGGYCSLCVKYFPFCECCPLASMGQMCSKPNSIWKNIDNSATWGRWLINAKEMLKILKSLKEG